MKRIEIIGTVTLLERLGTSSYGNPSYYIETQEGFKGKTALNIADAYGLGNSEGKQYTITYHTTRTGNNLIDYIREVKN